VEFGREGFDQRPMARASRAREAPIRLTCRAIFAILQINMSKRFPEFSRLYWQLARPRRKPQLHPAMRERMWKPGQSGNPSGVSRACLEAMQESLTRPIEASAGAERTRRWRSRKQNDLVVVSLEVSLHLTDGLIRRGWLDASKRHDKKAIAAALVSAFESAI
jgi:hypothetical protein